MSENKTEKTNTETGLEIAVIGMAARFPGAQTIEQFWENLKNNLESISFFSHEESTGNEPGTELTENPNYVKAWGVLDDIEYFDSDFFNFTPKEAEIMDPQLRVFLQCAWHALEDAGYNPDTYPGLTGLYAGNAPNSNWLAQCYLSGKINPGGEFAAALLNEHFSTQVSYHLNLQGPAISIRTACSTALVAIHMACVGLLGGECDMALAGGVTVMLPQKTGYIYQEGMIYSRDGHCRTFDARASGSVFGNGVGVVVLKRLVDARADRDFIYALVKGSAINNDGIRKVGYTAPSLEGQAAVIRSAFLMAGVEPSSIGYIEAHGTATPLGDPVEIAALKQAFNTPEKGFCAIGSVKTNLGHLNAAAGAAGFIKTVLALKHRLIPQNLNFQTLNPKIDLADTPFYINTELSPWKNDSYPRRAGVNAFGLGGTNAHIVLEETPGETGALTPLPVEQLSRQYQLLVLSAKTPTALERAATNLAEFFKQNPQIHLADAAYTLQMGRKPFQHRKMLVSSTIDESIPLLTQNSRKTQSFHARVENRPIVFMFPGQGDQYPDMGLDLYRNEPLFRKEMDRCFEILKPLLGNDPKDILYPPTGDADHKFHINQTIITQPLVFCFEYALTRLLMSWGVQPRAMIGYSLGEYTAACISGVFSPEDALKLVFTRGKLMQTAPAGAMLSVPLTEPELTPLLNKNISLAIINSSSCIVAGSIHAINAFEKKMKEKRLVCMRVNMGHAAHSLLMNPVKDQLETYVKTITAYKPKIPYISNVSGTWISIEEAADPGYWGTHLCSTVQFSPGLEELLKLENAIFIEIGPGRGLANLLRQHPGKKPGHQVVNIVKHPRQNIPDHYFLLTKLGQMWLYGLVIDWTALHNQEKRHRIPLPKYPFDRIPHWIGAAHPRGRMQAQDNSGNKSTDDFTRSPERSKQQSLRERPSLPDDYTPPRDEIEKLIAGIWQEVLGFSSIGIDENFFDLNGDSLTATQLVTRLQQVYPIELSLQEFFEIPTIAHLAKIVKKTLMEKIEQMNQGEGEKLQIPRRKIQSPVPMSFAQQRLWLLYQSAPGNPFYNMPFAFLLQGEFNIEILQKSLDEIVKRHETLRTTFTMVDNQPVQVIAPELKIKLNIMDLQEFPQEEQEAEARRLAGEEVRKPFNLEQGPLLRITLLKPGGNNYVLLLTMHHIISDGWSMGIFIREMAALLTAFSAGKPSPLPALPIQYADFALWQRQRLQVEVLKKQLSFWKKHLGGHLPILELPLDHQRPAVQTFRGAKKEFHLEEALSQHIMQLTRQQRCSPFMTLLATLNILFYRYCGQEDIMIGSPIANRNRAELEGIIGFFANTLVFRANLSMKPTFLQLLDQIRQVTLGAFDNQDLPFEKLIEEFQPQRYTTHNPIFQVMFNFQNIPVEEVSSSPGLAVQSLDIHNETSKFDLWISISPQGSILQGAVEYSTDIFEESTIARLTRHFQTLLAGIVKNPAQTIDDLPLLTGEEKQQLLIDWNNTGKEYHLKSLQWMFTQQAAKTPASTALIFENHHLSYDELNQRARQLSFYLVKQGIKADTPVGICMERSLAMVIGLLGILNAGGAYLPLDPEYPRDRLDYILADSRAKMLLSTPHLSTKLKKLSIDNCQLLMVNEMPPNRPNNYQLTINNLQLKGDSLAYIIYTSGTTGKPKGVMISNQGICNRLLWMQETYGLTAQDRVLQKTPFSFDVSVWEFFWPLSTGAGLVMAKPRGHKDNNYLVQTINKQQITTIHFVPSMLNVFLESPQLQQIHSLKRVISSGEVLPVEYREKFFSNLDTELHNLYGPTEASVDVTAWCCNREKNRHIIPIGRPIANTRIYILDRQLNPVPIGIHGEIYISGIQLARGYLNKPELTAEKFDLRRPGGTLFEKLGHHRSYGSYKSYIFYRTGDLARWRPDGNIEFLGRIDHQVKIRGFRIELDEIRSRLLNIPGIKEAVVSTNQNNTGEKYLCAYIVSNSLDEPPDKSQLREILSHHLPDYMIPTYFVPLEKIPLTSSGKVNQKALPVPEIRAGDDYVPPRNDIETKLLEIWTTILGINKNSPIGINDNFFAWGGNSLTLIKMAAEIHKEFATEVPIMQDFQNPRISEISRYIIDNKYVAGEENPVLVLNPGKDQALFCFPPLIGYGLAYMELPNFLEDYTLYSFNFIEDDHCIEKYIELITKFQPTGPYRMFAYSAGGELAIETAHRLEQLGHRVIDIILLDCRRADQQWGKITLTDFLNIAVQGLEAMGIGFLKEKVTQKIKRYVQYLKNLRLQPINTRLHLVTSLEKQGSDNRGPDPGEKKQDQSPDFIEWAELTHRDCFIYKGFGPHIDMLSPNYIKQNTDLIRGILTGKQPPGI